MIVVWSLFAHLVGDYVFQTDKQANGKTTTWFQACMHALTYTLCFVVLTRDWRALLVIWSTHVLIDHYRLPKHVIWLKNTLGDFPNMDWSKYRTNTGYSEQTPAWMATWLFIITDNTFHLLINAWALVTFK